MLLAGMRGVWMDSIQYARDQYLTKDTLHCVSCMGRAGPDRAGEGEGVWRETAVYGGAAIASISTSHGMFLCSGHHLRAEGCGGQNMAKCSTSCLDKGERSLNLLPPRLIRRRPPGPGTICGPL